MLYEIHTGKKHKNLIDGAMSFVIHHLDIPEDVWVDIFVKSCNNCGGVVHMEKEDEWDYYQLDINSRQSSEEIVATLFHEMKHVEQTATGRLNQYIFEGKDYSNVDYWDRPWEKEAYAFESRTILRYNMR